MEPVLISALPPTFAWLPYASDIATTFINSEPWTDWLVKLVLVDCPSSAPRLFLILNWFTCAEYSDTDSSNTAKKLSPSNSTSIIGYPNRLAHQDATFGASPWNCTSESNVPNGVDDPEVNVVEPVQILAWDILLFFLIIQLYYYKYWKLKLKVFRQKKRETFRILSNL